MQACSQLYERGWANLGQNDWRNPEMSVALEDWAILMIKNVHMHEKNHTH